MRLDNLVVKVVNDLEKLLCKSGTWAFHIFFTETAAVNKFLVNLECKKIIYDVYIENELIIDLNNYPEIKLIMLLNVNKLTQ